jgi:hypothetical protein
LEGHRWAILHFSVSVVDPEMTLKKLQSVNRKSLKLNVFTVRIELVNQP